MHQFETHVNGFLEPESPNHDPNNAFLSSLEAEIITFLLKKAAIFFFLLLRPSYKYFNVAPLTELIVRPHRPLLPNGAFIHSVTVILLTDSTKRCNLIWLYYRNVL